MAAEVSQVLAWGMDLPAFRGKVFHLCEPDQVTKAKYESWLKRTAMEECIDASQGLPDAEQEKNRRIILGDVALRKFRWGGEVFGESLKTEGGMVKLISLMLRDNKKREVDEATVTEMLKDDKLAPWILGAVYIVCGMDPTMALTAGQMTVVEAGKQKDASRELVNQIMNSKAGTSSATSPSSGPPTPG